MTAPCAPDPLTKVINIVVGALLQVFDPDQDCPPLGGGSDTVRIFAGDATPLAAFDAHTAATNCAQPFLWIRTMRRYRSKVFPNPTLALDCDLPKVAAVEIGVGRCSATTDQQPSWEDWAEEAAVSTSDAFRIEGALCIATATLTDQGHSAGSDLINPYGPEGGVVAQIANLYATY
jgi:hypothetical protein